MGSWSEAHWESTLDGAVPRAARRAGSYEQYRPDMLDGVGISVTGQLSRRVASVERAIRTLNGPDAEGLSGIARFLLRSEAIASSQIEGITPSAKQIALAELGQSEPVHGLSEQAKLVANNMTIVREATSRLVEKERLMVDDIVLLHSSLLRDEPRHHGLRTVQNWIGASGWSPIGASFVPPPPELVPDLMTDLIDYVNGAALSPLLQAGVVHAQFETIHPFTDGNGRVGRALIQLVLARRGLTPQAVLPISLVLATLRRRYVDGLTSFRHDSAAGSPAASDAIGEWLAIFVEAAALATERASHLKEDIDELQSSWRERLTEYRRSIGLRPSPRTGSASQRLLGQLSEAPVVTATTLARILGVSFPAAIAALEELRQADILSTTSIERGATAYIAREVLDLVTWSERALASTQFDTDASPPIGGVPAKPQQA